MAYHNRSTADWQRLDARHHLHPFTDPAVLARDGARILCKGDGVYLWDVDGKRYLDGMAGLWCVNVGYGRASLAQAMARQAEELAYYNAFFMTATPAQAELAARIADLTPGDLNHVFFGNSGSDANDSIVRTVWHYWRTLGQPKRRVFISRLHAYHGSTLTGASLGGWKNMHALGDTLLPGFEHIMPPYWYVFGGDLTPDDFGLVAAEALEKKILEIGPDNVAAFIGEPVMGAGGVIVPPATYWPEIQRICRNYGILLIADEVICGFGRTGEWFGSQTLGITPDIMTIAKGLSSGYAPISAMVLSDDVYRVLADGGEFAHGYTYSGHPVSCATALENIRIMEEESLVARVRDDIGPYFQHKLRSLGDHPLVGEVRGVGLLGGVELARDKATRTLFDSTLKVGAFCMNLAFERGVIIRAIRDVLEFSPPLIITHQQVDTLIDETRAILDAAAQQFAIA